MSPGCGGPCSTRRSSRWALPARNGGRLANLSRHDTEGVIQSDLARLLGVGKVTVGGLIDRLKAGGLVERRAHPFDRRIKRIFIIPHGFEVIKQMAKVGRELNAVILRSISAEGFVRGEYEVLAVEDKGP